jgi:hypothetical protein
MLVIPFARPWGIAMFQTISQSHYRVQQHAASGGHNACAPVCTAQGYCDVSGHISKPLSGAPAWGASGSQGLFLKKPPLSVKPPQKLLIVLFYDIMEPYEKTEENFKIHFDCRRHTGYCYHLSHLFL